MKIITKYQCEICEYIHDSKVLALNCEKRKVNLDLKNGKTILIEEKGKKLRIGKVLISGFSHCLLVYDDSGYILMNPLVNICFICYDCMLKIGGDKTKFDENFVRTCSKCQKEIAICVRVYRVWLDE